MPADAASARDPAIDALRGLAILTMIAANMAPYSLEAPHPFPLRVYGSFAAPTFVFLAGMMIGTARKPPSALGVLRRSAGLFTVAAGIDFFCWDIAPFESFDVLYLIGLALPAAALCLALDVRFHALLGMLILVLTPFARARLGYGPLLDEPEPWPVWRRLLVDGWFPVFPWLGVALLGAAASRVRGMVSTRAQIAVGGALVLFGLLGFVVAPLQLITRAGYSELFYPPTLRYLAVALGALILLFHAVPVLRKRVPLGFLETLGRASLLMYVAHTVLIAFAFKVLFRPQPFPRFLALYVAHAVILWVIARGKVALDARRGRSRAVTASP